MGVFTTYILLVVLILVVTLIILKYVIMKIFDFYDYVNIAIWIIMVLILSFYFFPKNIDSYVGIRSNDCGCFGLKLLDKDNSKDVISCYGIKTSCISKEMFNANAAKDINQCDKENIFYEKIDSCYSFVAKDVAQKAVNGDRNFGKALGYCDKISDAFVKSDCVAFVKTLEAGGFGF